MDIESYVRDNILRDGEEILWKGRPDPNRLLTRALSRAVFGVIFLGFAVYVTISNASRGGPQFALIGVPFLAVGAWIAITPLRERWRAGRTYYAVTDRRALIIEAGRTIRTTAIGPAEITALQRVDRPGGNGDLRFRQTVTRGRRSQRSQTNFDDGFWGATDIKGAEEAVGRLLTAAQAS